MMLVKTGCMQNPNDLGAGMSNSSMKDFVTSKERLSNPWKLKAIGYEVLAVVIIMFAIGSLQSWL